MLFIHNLILPPNPTTAESRTHYNFAWGLPLMLVTTKRFPSEGMLNKSHLHKKFHRFTMWLATLVERRNKDRMYVGKLERLLLIMVIPPPFNKYILFQPPNDAQFSQYSIPNRQL